MYSLNIKTLNDLISLVENYPLLTKDLKEVALKFKKSKRPAVKGLCLFEYSHGIYSKHFFWLAIDYHDYPINFNNTRDYFYISSNYWIQN